MSGNKLIVKNTLYLYIRMFLTMGISLYVSRIVLQQLGIENYGIYSVVGSLTLFFQFMNYGISNSLQRFLAYNIGINDTNEIHKCFSAGLAAILLICLAVILLGEFTGLLALKYIIEIPAGRESDALFVFQFSLLILVLNTINGSFESLILANERMSFFAYLAIAEAGMKLVLAFLLPIMPGDKLHTYIILLTVTTIIILICHITYCRINFPYVRITLKGARERLRAIFSFTGWNTLSSFADLCYLQGSNIILNSFFGVALNAAMGVTNQVKNAVSTFSRNIQVAANPQMIKDYARGDYKNFSSLTYTISKISYLLLLIIGIPILLNTNTILSLWLTIVPPYTATFIRLMICFCLLNNLVGPLWIAMQASGNIRNYQITLSIVWLLSLPTMYIALKLGGGPQSILLTHILFIIITLAIRLWFASRYCHLPIKEYIHQVLTPIISISVISFIAPLAATLCFEAGITLLIITSILSLITLPIATYIFGLSKSERQNLLEILRNKFK